jgi:hypothetical protein
VIAPDQRLACEEANMISPVWNTAKFGAAMWYVARGR